MRHCRQCVKEQILAAREEVKKVHVHELLLDYMAELVQATRKDKEILSGVSPRGTIPCCGLLRHMHGFRAETMWYRRISRKLPVSCDGAQTGIIQGFGGAVTGKIKIEEILSKVSVPTEEWER